MVRCDTYEQDDQPPHRTFDEAMVRKIQLKHQGYRVKIRKDSDGVFVVWKKHDELLHGPAWRETNG